MRRLLDCPVLLRSGVAAVVFRLQLERALSVTIVWQPKALPEWLQIDKPSSWETPKGQAEGTRKYH